MTDYEELARRAERGELPVKAGTVQRGAAAVAQSQELLMQATGTTTIEDAVAVALAPDRA